MIVLNAVHFSNFAKFYGNMKILQKRTNSAARLKFRGCGKLWALVISKQTDMNNEACRGSLQSVEARRHWNNKH